METSNDCFVIALQVKLKEQGRGAKKKLANQVGISPNHLSDILGNRKNAGQKLKEHIAHSLKISFEQMLAQGRQIIEKQAITGNLNSEMDRESTKKKSNLSKDDLIVMVNRIIESNTFFGEALINNIITYHQAINLVQQEKATLRILNDLQNEIRSVRNEIKTLKSLEDSDKDSSNPQAA